MSLHVGDSVQVTNLDSVAHTFTDQAQPRYFDSGNLSQNQSFRFTFAKAGTFHVVCSYHPQMAGTITVS